MTERRVLALAVAVTVLHLALLVWLLASVRVIADGESDVRADEVAL
jgi:hypothetical protein